MNRNCVFETIAGQTKPGKEVASFGVSNMSKLCLDINKACSGKSGITRVRIKVDSKKKSWEIKVLESPPTTVLFKKFLDETKEKIFSNLSQGKKEEIIERIAEIKKSDLNTKNPQKWKKIVIGSLRSFGVKVVE